MSIYLARELSINPSQLMLQTQTNSAKSLATDECDYMRSRVMTVIQAFNLFRKLTSCAHRNITFRGPDNAAPEENRNGNDTDGTNSKLTMLT